MLPFLFCLIFLKKILQNKKGIFFIYTLITAILICFAVYFVYGLKEKSYYYIVTRTHLLIEFLLISYIFVEEFRVRKPIFKKLYFLLGFIFLIFSIVDYLISKPSHSFTLYVTEYIVFIFSSIYLFSDKLKNEEAEFEEPFFSSFIFWLAVAFLITASGNLFLFIYTKTITVQDSDFKANYTIMYTTVTITKDILLCFAISRLPIKNRYLGNNIADITEPPFPLNNLN